MTFKNGMIDMEAHSTPHLMYVVKGNNDLVKFGILISFFKSYRV